LRIICNIFGEAGRRVKGEGSSSNKDDKCSNDNSSSNNTNNNQQQQQQQVQFSANAGRKLLIPALKP